MKKESLFPKIVLATLITGTCTLLRAATDEQKERFFHQIYTRFNSTPTPVESWNTMLQRLQVNVYTVQEGDTLWDISQTLFADPNFWPKIWAMNADKIYNPHQITPDQEVLFYPGSSELPPSLAPAADGKLPPLSKIQPKRLVPLVTQLPGSFPLLRFPVGSRGDEMSDESVKIADDFFLTPKTDKIVSINAYYTEEDLSSLKDEVISTEGEFKSAGLDDRLFVRVSNPSEKIYHVVSVHKMGPKREHHYVKVHAQIKLETKASQSDSVYRAVIEKVIEMPQIGYKLLPGPIPEVAIPGPGKPNLLSTTIIGGQFGENKLIPEGGFFFIDSGSSNGLSIGDILPIFSNPKIRTDNPILQENYRKVGEAQVVRVESKGATAYLLSAKDDIRVGDVSGSVGEVEDVTTSAPAATEAAPEFDSGTTDTPPPSSSESDELDF